MLAVGLILLCLCSSVSTRHLALVNLLRSGCLSSNIHADLQDSNI